MQRGNGAVIGKQNTPTTSVATGVWALNEVQRAVLNGTWPAATIVDPYFENVSLLLHGNGTNGAQNNTFLDSSTNNFTITRNGNTTQGTFTPYGSNWSNYFDGSGDYLTFPNNASMPFGTGSFTVEFWINGPLNNDKFILGGRAAIGGSLHITTGGVSGTTAGALRYVGSSTITSGSVLITDNTWHHVAIVRNGSSDITIYVDGTSVGTGTDTTNYTGTGGTWVIGANDFQFPNNVGSNQLNAYLSNLRIVKSAVYTGNFTPPTAPLTAITNTQLLTCADNRFIDDSTNNSTITVNGSPSVQRFSPFNPTAAYSAATIGGSGYFDGSGDWLSLADNAAWNMGSGDFTAEAWIYPTSFANEAMIMGQWSGDTGGTTLSWALMFSSGSTGYLRLITSSNGSSVLFDLSTSTFALTLNMWQHIAAVRSGNTYTIYVNGVSRATTTNSSALYDATNAFTIGAESNTQAQYFTGYISNLRVVKGTAVYTGAFTPPSTPVAAVSGTSLLCDFTNGGIFDNAMMNDLETVGNAQISTSVSKFGGGSLAFDGSGDWLQIPNSQNFNFGSGNFTVEGWVYCTNTSPRQDIFTTPANGSGFNGLSFGVYNGNFEITACWSSGSWQILFATAGTVNANTWYHFAVVRNGGTLTVYVNGTSTYSNTTLSTNSLVFGTDPATISYGRINQSDAKYLYGNIDDFRITKGYARYTANFTAPTLPFPDQ